MQLTTQQDELRDTEQYFPSAPPQKRFSQLSPHNMLTMMGCFPPLIDNSPTNQYSPLSTTTITFTNFVT